MVSCSCYIFSASIYANSVSMSSVSHDASKYTGIPHSLMLIVLACPALAILQVTAFYCEVVMLHK